MTVRPTDAHTGPIQSDGRFETGAVDGFVVSVVSGRGWILTDCTGELCVRARYVGFNFLREQLGTCTIEHSLNRFVRRSVGSQLTDTEHLYSTRGVLISRFLLVNQLLCGCVDSTEDYGSFRIVSIEMADRCVYLSEAIGQTDV